MHSVQSPCPLLLFKIQFKLKTIKIFEGLKALELNSSLPHISENWIKRDGNARTENKQSLIEKKKRGEKSKEMAVP